jgi:F-type H+-transporting ATPase subunit delta
MKSTKLARREAKTLLTLCMVNGLIVPDRVRAVANLLIKTKPRQYVAILSHFSLLLRLEMEKRAVRVQSVIGLPDALRGGLEEKLGRRYGQGLEYEFTLNPALLGGMRVQVGSDVYDGSIRARLNALEEKFN